MRGIITTALTVLVVGLWFSTPARADIDSSVVDSLAMDSYNQRKPTLDIANQAAQAKGLTLEALGKACKLMPVRIGAILSGQAPLEKKTQDSLDLRLEP